MAENNNNHSASSDSDEIKPNILEKIQELLSQLNVQQVYFIDDAIAQDTGKETFIGIIQAIIAMGRFEELRAINIQGLDFKLDEAVIEDHINENWDKINPRKQLKYFEKAHTIIGHPEAIQDLNVSNNLREYFTGTPIEFLSPNDWDEYNENILANIEDGKRIIVIFDQVLKLANGRFAEGSIQGEQLIAELKQKEVNDKVIIALLTHTVTEYEGELPKRKEICEKIEILNSSDFFVLAKKRLEKPALFSDGLKKVCLNTFCENVKNQTLDIINQAQKATIEKLRNLDTYDFDHTIFKSSFTEGVWEPETLLRVNDVIFRDAVRELMIQNNYVPSVNESICAARDVSKIEFHIDESVEPYKQRAKLRHQEMYESELLLNKLRRPIDNGDIFTITDGEKVTKKFILLAQECDLMVRSGERDKGTRGSRTATLVEIETLTEKKLNTDITKKYSKDIEKQKFQTHYFADKFKLEYFDVEEGKVGIVKFSKSIVIDLNVLDLIVFNENGEAELSITNPSYDENYHNYAWRSRHEIIKEEFVREAAKIQQQYSALECITDNELKNDIKLKINYLSSFIEKLGIQLSFDGDKFKFGIKRISRLRLPKSKNLLDRYYMHHSRFAEQHDFAS